MKIKYSPCNNSSDTEITVNSASSLTIDGKLYEFPEDGVSADSAELFLATKRSILEAHRTGGELYVTVRRFYRDTCQTWDTMDYHDVTVGETI